MTPTVMPDVPAPPARFNFAAHLLAVNAGRGDKTAFIDDRGRLSYAELDERVRRVASGLSGLGLQPGERLMLLMHDSSDWPVVFLGALYAGVVPVAANTLLTAGDYAYMLGDSGARAVVVSHALLPVLHQALAPQDPAASQAGVPAVPEGVRAVLVAGAPAAPEAEPALARLAATVQPLDRIVNEAPPAATFADTAAAEPAFWLYSSGSTGRPKGTVHAHASPYWTAELYGKRVLGLTEQDVCFSAAKLFFAYGLGNALSFPMSVGATTVLMAERPTPDAVFRRWREHHPTVFFGAPTGYAGMLASPNLPPRDAVALRLCSSAGEALPAELGQRFTEHFGCEVIDGIGSTEMLHIFLSNRPGRVRYGTTGWPVPGYDIELRDDDGQPVAAGETGDLYIRGPSTALMYWNQPDKTRDTFAGGWTRSGDKYQRNEDGSYTYAGRSDDMLKVSGIYVSPFEVEATLVQHPAVLEAAVIGVPDTEGLTRTKAYVVMKPGQSATEDALKAFVKERLAPYKYPRLIEFIDELPKTATGKIQRFRLREREAATPR